MIDAVLLVFHRICPMKIDTEQVLLAARTGLRAALIAERLGCTDRHVHRLLEQAGVPIAANPLIGTEDEPLVWATYRETMGESYRRIARRFCVSHETIRQYFSEPRQLVEPWA